MAAHETGFQPYRQRPCRDREPDGADVAPHVCEVVPPLAHGRSVAAIAARTVLPVKLVVDPERRCHGQPPQTRSSTDDGRPRARTGRQRKAMFSRLPALARARRNRDGHALGQGGGLPVQRGPAHHVHHFVHPAVLPQPEHHAPATEYTASGGGPAEPAGKVVVQVLLIVADPGDVAVGA